MINTFCRSGGVEIRGLRVTAISKKPPLGIPVYEKNQFVPYYATENMAVCILFVTFLSPRL